MAKKTCASAFSAAGLHLVWPSCWRLLMSDLKCFMQIKIICSSGGHFQKMTGGGMEYVGGETRLISVASTCNFTELSAALDRVTGSLTIHSGQSIASGSDSVSVPATLHKPLQALSWMVHSDMCCFQQMHNQSSM